MKTLLLLLVAIFFVGCGPGPVSTATVGVPYVQQIEADLFRVTLTNDGSLSEADARDVTLRKCAELTLARGYSHYNVEDAIEDGLTNSYLIRLTNEPGPDSVAAEAN